MKIDAFDIARGLNTMPLGYRLFLGYDYLKVSFFLLKHGFSC